MKKLTLKHRARNYTDRLGFSPSSYEGASAEDGWLAGYRACQKDLYETTYSRKFCGYCGRVKDGHTHKFCKICKRILEHCDGHRIK